VPESYKFPGVSIDILSLPLQLPSPAEGGCPIPSTLIFSEPERTNVQPTVTGPAVRTSNYLTLFVSEEDGNELSF